MPRLKLRVTKHLPAASAPFSRSRRPLSGLLLALAICGAPSAWAQTLRDNPGEKPNPNAGNLDGIKQSSPGFYVRASCDHPSGVYEQGDQLTLTVQCEVDAYLYVIYEQADSKRYQIFPNSGQPENRVQGGRQVHIPSVDDLFRWKVAPPLGKEKILVIASKTPLDSLSIPELRAKAFNPVSREQLKGAAIELDQQKEKTWTEHVIEITTVERKARPEPIAGGRRFGVFIGIGAYTLSEQPLQFAASDAKLTGATFNDAGGIPAENTIVLQDASATKQQMEQLITQQLPSMTRPGDTVVIYFSGHGCQRLDEPEGEPGHDEADGLEEFLCPNDQVGLGWYFKVAKKYLELLQGTQAQNQAKADQLQRENPELYDQVLRFQDIREKHKDAIVAIHSKGKSISDRLEQLKDRPDNDPEKKSLLDQSDKLDKQLESILAHETGISDDEFGHWIQRLDGRQVIVILDACNSGGMDQNAKRGQTKDLFEVPASFDFLDREASRLKDLGQGDVSLLAAAEAELGSLEYTNIKGGVFTFYLKKTLNELPGPLALDQVYQQIKLGMADFFVKYPPSKDNPVHHPQMANFGSQMPILKP